MVSSDSRARRAGSLGHSARARGGTPRRILSVGTAFLLAIGLVVAGWAGPLVGPAAAAVHLGKVMAWGANTYYTTNVPASALSGVQAVSAGMYATWPAGRWACAVVITWSS